MILLIFIKINIYLVHDMPSDCTGEASHNILRPQQKSLLRFYSL